jgi:hypothetical protein
MPAAQADPPDKTTFVDLGLIPQLDFDCGSFTLNEELISERVTVTTFSGEPERVMYESNFLGEVTNSATGETFRDHVAGIAVVEGGVVFESGVGFNIVRPAEGPILQRIGRRLIDSEGNLVVIGGPENVGDDMQAAVCAALA